MKVLITVKSTLWMRKTVWFMAISLSVILAGCRKYVCECTGMNVNTPEPYSTSRFQVNGTEKKRKAHCNDRTTTPDYYGNYTLCEIK